MIRLPQLLIPLLATAIVLVAGCQSNWATGYNVIAIRLVMGVLAP